MKCFQVILMHKIRAEFELFTHTVLLTLPLGFVSRVRVTDHVIGAHLDVRLRFFVKRSFQVTHSLRLRPHVRFFVKRYPFALRSQSSRPNFVNSLISIKFETSLFNAFYPCIFILFNPSSLM